jgi:hypothetical protein
MRLKYGEPWRFVTALEFEVFLQAYPRALEVTPSVERKANFRSYSDPSLGQWPGNVVATVYTGKTAAVFGVRSDMYIPPRAAL